MNNFRTLIALRRFAGCTFVLLIALNSSIDAAKARDKGRGDVLVLPLDSLNGLETKNLAQNDSSAPNTKVEITTYRGRRAFRMLLDTDGQAIAIVKKSHFKDGTIEADLAGMPRQGAPADARGFVGISFRVQDDGRRFETVYLRMTNGRADDQLRRNHSIQYTSDPDFPWYRLRKENPGAYESYVDLDAGAWTKIKIVVHATKASVYINDAQQPCLIVNDLKLGESSGQIALYATSNTDAYFSNLSVRPSQPAE